MSRELAPETAELLETLGEMRVPSWPALSVDFNRKMIEQLNTSEEPVQSVGAVKHLEASPYEGDVPVPLRVYEPEADPPYPTLVYFHGGGWVLGNLDCYDNFCRLLCARSDCLVVSVGYRLAPENPFPDGFLDCAGATRWVIENAPALGVNPDRVGVGGDSAGGNLAAAVCRKAAYDGFASLAFQLIIYPILDYSCEYPSFEENAEGYLLETADMDWFWDHYLTHPIHGRNPYVSPLGGTLPANLPPAHVVTCEFDPLRDQGVEYAGRLEEAGVEVTHEHYEGQIHGFLGFLHEPELPGASDELGAIGDLLGQRL